MRILSATAANASMATPTALVHALTRGGERLADRSVLEIAEVIGRVANRLLDPTAPLRTLALQSLPEEAGFSIEMAEAVLDGMAHEWTTRSLLDLVHSEFPDGTVLDTFVEAPEGGLRRALGESPQLHITSSNVPGVGVTSMIRGLLTKSAVLLKPGRRDRVLSTLFLDALIGEDAEVGAAAAVVEWDADDVGVHAGVGAAALIVVYGGEAVTHWARRHARPSARIITYPHRVSAALVMDEPEHSITSAAEPLARAVAMFDQRGCVSPHTVYVVSQEASEARAAAVTLAEAVADALSVLDTVLPPGVPQVGESSAFHQLAGTVELEAASGAGPVVFGAGRRWRVVAEPRPGFKASCLGRFLWVRPLSSIGAVADELSAVASHLQTLGVWGRVGLEGLERLARAGVRRIAPVEQAPWPAARVRHDGVAPLGSLLRWIEVDEGDLRAAELTPEG